MTDTSQAGSRPRFPRDQLPAWFVLVVLLVLAVEAPEHIATVARVLLGI